MTRVALRDALVPLFLLALAFAAYSLLWSEAPLLFPDSPGYMRLASDMKNLHLTELHQRTPGYAVLLLLTGSEREPTRLLYQVSLAMYLGTVALLAYILFVLGIQRALILGFIILALLPPFVAPATWVLTENLTQCVLDLTYASLLFWLFTGRSAFLAILTLAATFCAFVRPTYEVLMPVLTVTLLIGYAFRAVPPIRLRRLAFAMCLATLFVLGAIGAYSFLNYSAFGYFGTSSMSPYTLSTKTVGVLEYLPPQYKDLQQILIKHRDARLLTPFDDHMALGYIHEAMPEVIHHYGGDRVAALEAVEAANVYLIEHKPMSYLNECLKLLGPYWMPNEYPIASEGSHLLRSLWALLQATLVVAFLVQCLALSGVGLLRISERVLVRPSFAWTEGPDAHLVCAYIIGLVFILYTMLLSCFLGNGTARYRVPTDLLIVSTSIIGLAIWAQLVRMPGSGFRYFNT